MNLKKNLCKKWYEWYEDSEYQQVIHHFLMKMVREWYECVCKCGVVKRQATEMSFVVFFMLFYVMRRGKGGVIAGVV